MSLSPIDQMCAVHGEDAMLYTTPNPAYDPASVTDYTPGTPVGLAVRGFVANIDNMVAGLSQSANAGFTIAAKTDLGIVADSSTLLWRGKTSTILRFRERHFEGALDGFTLVLGK